MPTTIDEFEYLYIMEETELDEVVRAMLPIVKVDAEKNKYMIGTVCHVVQVKTDRLLIRVGGGYQTLEEFIHQNGPFEVIKIHKVMRQEHKSFE